MALETPVNTIYDLVATNPTVGDPKSQGDDHFRNIKAGLLASFAGTTGGTSSYQKIGKKIIQIGTVSVVAGTATVTFPIPFPTAVEVCFSCLLTSSSTTPFIVGNDSGTTTGMHVYATTVAGAAASVSAAWVAFGY